MNEYPRMLYRDGTTERVWNLHDVDLLTVANAEQEAAAIEDGWRRTPTLEELHASFDPARMLRQNMTALGSAHSLASEVQKRKPGRPRKQASDENTVALGYDLQ